MTQTQKVIKAKVGLLELAKQLGNVSQGCKILGYSRDSFYRSRTFTTKVRTGAVGDQPQEADSEEPCGAVDRGGGGRPGDRAAVLGPAACRQRTAQAGDVDLAVRGARGVAAARPGEHQEAAEGAGGEGGAGGADLHRGAARRPRLSVTFAAGEAEKLRPGSPLRSADQASPRTRNSVVSSTAVVLSIVSTGPPTPVLAS
jgi:hypothetical protein